MPTRPTSETPLELMQQGDQLIVRTNQDRVNDDLRVSSDLEITVPKGASIEAHGRYGDFDIRDITGSVDITSDNAGVRLENIGGNVRVEVRKSDIVRATAVKGALELKGRGQDVDLQNIDGQVTINGDFLGQVQIRNLAQPVRWEAAHTDLQFEKLPGQLHMGPGELTANESRRSDSSQLTGARRADYGFHAIVGVEPGARRYRAAAGERGCTQDGRADQIGRHRSGDACGREVRIEADDR